MKLESMSLLISKEGGTEVNTSGKTNDGERPRMCNRPEDQEADSNARNTKSSTKIDHQSLLHRKTPSRPVKKKKKGGMDEAATRGAMPDQNEGTKRDGQ